MPLKWRKRIAEKGDTVLFLLCASFDLFENYEDRESVQEAVQNL
jgi:UDP-N-acetylmuramoylalanine-D-glutamate ligase